MDNSYMDEMYAILDELNAQIEDMVSEYDNPETVDLIISLFNQKAHEFVDELQQEIEKMELIEI
jgi:hypothetical protein